MSRTRINAPSVMPVWMTKTLEACDVKPHPMWLYIDIQGPDDCWPWFGVSNVDGYGRAFHESKRVLAHRLSYCLHNAVDFEEFRSTGLLVRHTCDNPPCCNPRHLISGTHAENMSDKVARGRTYARRGSAVNTAILNEETVQAVKRRLKFGDRRRDIASDFGVSLSAIDRINSGQNWAWVQE